jgi:FMN reductase (NADPH)
VGRPKESFRVRCGGSTHESLCQLADDRLALSISSANRDRSFPDAALVGMSAAIAAESLGLGTVMIGGVRNEPLKICELLGAPPQCFVVFGMCLGTPLDYPPQKPRLPEEAIIHFERYDDSTVDHALASYDELVSKHYQEVGRMPQVATWTARVAAEFSRARRAELRSHLRALGFPAE